MEFNLFAKDKCDSFSKAIDQNDEIKSLNDLKLNWEER